MAQQRWRRLGHVFCADQQAHWMFGYASYPTPLTLDRDHIRVYFSPRDRDNRSSIASLDLYLQDGRYKVLALPDQPLLTPGQRGSFDDSGVTVSCVVPQGDRLFLYYLGWNVSVTVPFRNFIGLAVGSLDAARFERHSIAPIIERSAVDPFTLGYPWVLPAAGGMNMWYGSHLEWGPQGLSMLHAIKTAHSRDGITWNREGHIAIPLRGGSEYAVSRPCVLKDADRYRMWYSRREEKYCMGYAESSDNKTWHRHDDRVTFTGTIGDWENESAAYATIFDHGGRRYMLYNGNGYGRTGFGLAVLE